MSENRPQYARTRTRKKTTMKTCATNIASAAAAEEQVVWLPKRSAVATLTSAGEFALDACLMNHFTVSKGVLASPTMSQEN